MHREMDESYIASLSQKNHTQTLINGQNSYQCIHNNPGCFEKDS